jgi:hypothetical protein
MNSSQTPRERGRPHVSWNSEDRWFLIQLALLAKELRLVADEPDGQNESVPTLGPETPPDTRPLRPNHGAARFAFYWAHGAEPSVDASDPKKPMIGFSPVDDQVEAVETYERDIMHVRRALDGDFQRYRVGDLRTQDSSGTATIQTERLRIPGIAITTAQKILAVHMALGVYLLPRDLMLDQLRQLVGERLTQAGWPQLCAPLFDGLSQMPDLKERFRRVGTLYPLTPPSPTTK